MNYDHDTDDDEDDDNNNQTNKNVASSQEEEEEEEDDDDDGKKQVNSLISNDDDDDDNAYKNNIGRNRNSASSSAPCSPVRFSSSNIESSSSPSRDHLLSFNNTPNNNNVQHQKQQQQQLLLVQQQHQNNRNNGAKLRRFSSTSVMVVEKMVSVAKSPIKAISRTSSKGEAHRTTAAVAKDMNSVSFSPIAKLRFLSSASNLNNSGTPVGTGTSASSSSSTMISHTTSAEGSAFAFSTGIQSRSRSNSRSSLISFGRTRNDSELSPMQFLDQELEKRAQSPTRRLVRSIVVGNSTDGTTLYKLIEQRIRTSYDLQEKEHAIAHLKYSYITMIHYLAEAVLDRNSRVPDFLGTNNLMFSGTPSLLRSQSSDPEYNNNNNKLKRFASSNGGGGGGEQNEGGSIDDICEDIEDMYPDKNTDDYFENAKALIPERVIELIRAIDQLPIDMEATYSKEIFHFSCFGVLIELNNGLKEVFDCDIVRALCLKAYHDGHLGSCDVEYLLEQTSRLLSTDSYIHGTDKDCIYSDNLTTHEVRYEGVLLIDLGIERKKWMRELSHAKFWIFSINISVSSEHVVKSLHLFRELRQSPYLEDSPVIVVVSGISKLNERADDATVANRIAEAVRDGIHRIWELSRSVKYTRTYKPCQVLFLNNEDDVSNVMAAIKLVGTATEKSKE